MEAEPVADLDPFPPHARAQRAAAPASASSSNVPRASAIASGRKSRSASCSVGNAAALRDVVSGKPGAYRDIAIFNAAGVLVVAGKAATLKDGAGKAAEAIDSGMVSALLDRVIAVSNA